MMPTEVNVLGKPYRVELVEREAGTDYGECFADQCRIEVASFQCEHQKCDTLWHEVLHAVDHEANTRISERQIRLLATLTLCVLRLNRDLVEYLLQEPA